MQATFYNKTVKGVNVKKQYTSTLDQKLITY